MSDINSNPNQAQGSGSPDQTTQNQTSGANQTTGAGNSAQTPSPDTNEWEKKYKGLQTAYNKLDQTLKKAQDDLNSSLGTIEEQKMNIVNLTKQVTDLTTSVGAKDKDIEVAKSEASTKGIEATRLKLIVKEFPELSAFEAQGVLPAATTEEDMRTKFAGFRTALASTVGDGVKDKLKGASLPASSTTPTIQSVDQLRDQLDRIAGKPDKRDEFLKLRDQYDAAIAAQSESQ